MTTIKLAIPSVHNRDGNFTIALKFNNSDIVSSNTFNSNCIVNTHSETISKDNIIHSPICEPNCEIIDHSLYQRKRGIIWDNRSHPEIIKINDIYHQRFYIMMFKIYKHKGYGINKTNYVHVNGRLYGPNSIIKCTYHDNHIHNHDWDMHVKPNIVIPWILQNKSTLLNIIPELKFNDELIKEFNNNSIKCSALGNHDDPIKFLYGGLIVWNNYDANSINRHLDNIWHKWFGDVLDKNIDI